MSSQEEDRKQLATLMDAVNNLSHKINNTTYPPVSSLPPSTPAVSSSLPFSTPDLSSLSQTNPVVSTLHQTTPIYSHSALPPTSTPYHVHDPQYDHPRITVPPPTGKVNPYILCKFFILNLVVINQ